MRQLDPAWVNIHQPSARAIQQVQDAAPNARIMLRSWDIDDHDGDRKREMYADPRGAARKHLEMWRAKWDELVTEMHRNGWRAETDRWYISLVNEPDPAYVPQVVEYSAEAMFIVRGTLIRLGLVASSVGTFAKPSEGDYGWTQFIPLEKPINDGGHILIAHEYWQPEGPSFGEDGGNLAWRHHSIPLDVPILIRESGANGYIYGRYSENDDSGWQKTVKDEHGNPDPYKYAEQVKEFIEGCDTRVKGVLLYMLDFHDDQWWSFNTQPAMHQLLAIKDARPRKPSPFAKPVETHLPAISNGNPPVAGQAAYVAVPAGANLRSNPYITNGNLLLTLPYGEAVEVIRAIDDGQWSQVRYQSMSGFIKSDLLSRELAEKLPQTDMRSNWERAWPIVLKIEGGLSLDPNDSGNYYQGQLVGTKYGISAAVWGGQYDIPKLTQEEALQIYRTHYWEAAGCDRLPWPMCLIHFDTAVQHGVGVANEILNSMPTREQIYLGIRSLRYMDDPKWRLYGEAWGMRVDHLQDIAKGA